jgi:hypothetical protein
MMGRTIWLAAVLPVLCASSQSAMQPDKLFSCDEVWLAVGGLAAANANRVDKCLGSFGQLGFICQTVRFRVQRSAIRNLLLTFVHLAALTARDILPARANIN